MYCPNCGIQLPDRASDCMHCGTKVSGVEQPHQKYEVREEFIDLRPLKIRLFNSYSHLEQHDAWQKASQSVFDVIRKLTEQGWELVEREIGFNLLVLEPVPGAFGFLRALSRVVAATQLEHTDRGPVVDVVRARLHFKRLIKAGQAPASPGQKRFGSEAKRFSPEARKGLEGSGYVIYLLQGKSLKELRGEKGEPIPYDFQLWEPRYGGETLMGHAFWSDTTPPTEVAINPRQTFLPNSADKSFKYHQEIVDRFSEEISKKVKEVRAIIGEAANYAELALLHRAATGQKLFMQDDQCVFTATKTPYGEDEQHDANEFLVEVGEDEKGIRCHSYRLAPQGKYDVLIMPLVVPI